MEKDSGKKSARNPDQKVLGMLPSDRIERLLYEWANLPERATREADMRRRHPAYERIVVRFPEMFPFNTAAETYRVLATVREGLRQIWNTPDARQRDWIIFTLRNLYQRSRTREEHNVRDLFESQSSNDVFPPLPDLTAFEAAMIHLQNGLVHRMLHCPNPDCAAPYFFRGEKGQKSCSPECGDWLRRKSKLRWYHNAANSPKNR